MNILAWILDSERNLNGSRSICGSYDHNGSRFYPVFGPGFWILVVRKFKFALFFSYLQDFVSIQTLVT